MSEGARKEQPSVTTERMSLQTQLAGVRVLVIRNGLLDRPCDHADRDEWRLPAANATTRYRS